MEHTKPLITWNPQWSLMENFTTYSWAVGEINGTSENENNTVHYNSHLKVSIML